MFLYTVTSPDALLTHISIDDNKVTVWLGKKVPVHLLVALKKHRQENGWTTIKRSNLQHNAFHRSLALDPKKSHYHLLVDSVETVFEAFGHMCKVDSPNVFISLAELDRLKFQYKEYEKAQAIASKPAEAANQAQFHDDAKPGLLDNFKRKQPIPAQPERSIGMAPRSAKRLKF